MLPKETNLKPIDEPNHLGQTSGIGRVPVVVRNGRQFMRLL